MCSYIKSILQQLPLLWKFVIATDWLWFCYWTLNDEYGFLFTALLSRNNLFKYFY